MHFNNIRNICVDKPASWKDKIFLTFDLDWASDEVLSFTLDIVEEYGINATFFVTHGTPLLKRVRRNPKLEIGIHPNFNFLLNGDFRYGRNVEQVVRYYKKIAPEACSARSHSMVQSTQILEAFAENGIQYDCNHFIPFEANIVLKPWFFWDRKLIKVPYFWEDDAHCLYDWDWSSKKYTAVSNLMVFDFHPAHIFLNTDQMGRYNLSKKHLSDVTKLSKHVNSKYYGIRNFLIDLIEKNL